LLLPGFRLVPHLRQSGSEIVSVAQLGFDGAEVRHGIQQESGKLAKRSGLKLALATCGSVVIFSRGAADNSAKPGLKGSGQALTTGAFEAFHLLFHTAIRTNPEANDLQGHGPA